MKTRLTPQAMLSMVALGMVQDDISNQRFDGHSGPELLAQLKATLKYANALTTLALDVIHNLDAETLRANAL